MEIKYTLEILTKDIQDIEKLVANLENSPGNSTLDLDLALSKLRNVYDVLTEIRSDMERSRQEVPEAKADEEARMKAEQEARKKADEEARMKAEQEARKKADEEARMKAGQEARIKGRCGSPNESRGRGPDQRPMWKPE
jgi:FKBP-type peptidyl-prolyl cis-trans isomerase